MDANQMGGFIARQRKSLGLTQVQLAERVHVFGKTVSKWENGYGLPDIGNLELLAEALEISLTELMLCQGDEQERREEKEEASLRETLELAQQKIRKAKRTSLVEGILCGLSLILADIVILVYVEHAIFTDLLGILIVVALVWVGSTFRELQK